MRLKRPQCASAPSGARRAAVWFRSNAAARAEAIGVNKEVFSFARRSWVPSPLVGKGQDGGATLQVNPLPLTPSHKGREEKKLPPAIPNCRVISLHGERELPSPEQE